MRSGRRAAKSHPHPARTQEDPQESGLDPHQVWSAVLTCCGGFWDGTADRSLVPAPSFHPGKELPGLSQACGSVRDPPELSHCVPPGAGQGEDFPVTGRSLKVLLAQSLQYLITLPSWTSWHFSLTR